MEFIGIQKEKAYYRLAYLSVVQGKEVIQCLEKEQSLPEVKKKLLTVTGIEGQDLLIRHLTSPLKKKRALEKTLPFQLEPLIPYSLDDVIVKPLFYRSEEGTEAHFYCIPKEALAKHLRVFQDSGIDPDWVSTVPTALHRFAAFVAPEESSLVVFHIGINKIQLVSIDENKLFSHVTLYLGAEDLVIGDSAKVVEKLKREVDRALCFMAHKREIKGSQKVLFCGEKVKEVRTLLEKEERFLEAIEIEGHRGFSGESVRPYAIPIGLALDALKNDPFSVQLRQEDYISKGMKSTLKRGMIQGGALAAALFILTWTFATLCYTKKENGLIREIHHIVSHYETLLPVLQGGVTGKKLESILTQLDQKLMVPKASDALYGPPPLVTDLLAFISTHPMLEGIDVKRIDYTLAHYPTIKKRGEPYRPKVHLIFVAEEAKKARDFHDAIVDDDQFVDKEGEIEWKRNENEYEMAFFIRT
jgi:type IV pilus assembly protein PilM